MQNAPYAPFLHGSSRNAKLCCDHVRLCVNSVLLRPRTSPPPSAIRSTDRESSTFHFSSPNRMEETGLDKAIAAATAIIQTHYDASLQDQAMCYAVDVSVKSTRQRIPCADDREIVLIHHPCARRPLSPSRGTTSTENRQWCHPPQPPASYRSV